MKISAEEKRKFANEVEFAKSKPLAFDDDCPELSPAMQEKMRYASMIRNRGLEDGACIHVLQKVLEKRFTVADFSLDGYQECAVCLQRDGNKWLVFLGERGNHYEEIRCNTTLEACLRLIRKLAGNSEEISAIEAEFFLGLELK